MADMTDDQRQLARHALGLPNDNRRSYRNRFVAGPSPDNDVWRTMVAAGFAEMRAGVDWMGGMDDAFWLTRTGASAALNSDEMLCPEDFPPDTSTGPLAGRVAQALADGVVGRLCELYDLRPSEARRLLANIDLLRRAGIGEPVGLVWREDAGLGQSVAEVPFLGAYRVYPTATTQRYAYLLGHIGGQRIGDSEFHTFPDEATARAACEADHQARALTMWPALAGEVERLREALIEAKFWHEARDKARSKQPPSSDGKWRRMEHQEERDRIDAALVSSPRQATPVDDHETPSVSVNPAHDLWRQSPADDEDTHG